MDRFNTSGLSNPVYCFLICIFVFSLGYVVVGQSYRPVGKADPIIAYILDRQQRVSNLSDTELKLESFIGSIDLYRDNLFFPASAGIKGTCSRNRVTEKELDKTGMYDIGVIAKFTKPAIYVDMPGLTITSTMGRIATAIANVNSISSLLAADDVEYLASSRPVYPLLTESVPAVNAASLHNTQPMDRGEGVIIGFVDSGIDYDHLDFRRDEDGQIPGEETSRISFIWDQTDGYGLPPNGYSYGSEYSKSQIEQDIRSGLGPTEGAVREVDEEGHGTHIAGIASGDGSSSDLGFVGMAPDSSLISVKTTFSTSSVLDGVSYIEQKAYELGQPVVVTNLSLGTQYGPHDGTSLFEETLTNLSSDSHIIVVSAGNSGDKNIHLGVDTYLGMSEEYSIYLPVYSPSSEVSDHFNLDGYYDSGGYIEAKVIGPDQAETDWVGKGEAASFVMSSGSVLISNGPSTITGDTQLFVRVGDLQPDTPPDPGNWRLRIRAASSSRLDMWVSSNLLGNACRDIEFSEGNTKMTIAEPGNARDVITVGSFNTRNSWDGKSVFGFPAGSLSDYSSKGPTRDGRVKPDVSAPGAWVVSTLSGSANVDDFYLVSDGLHWSMAGTSVSAPHVAGATALVWYAAPESTGAEVTARLCETTDSEGVFLPNNEWGWGKLNVGKSVFSFGISGDELDQDLWIRATPNPAQEYADLFYSYPEGAAKLRIEIYNVLGRVVKEIDESELTDGLKYRWYLKNDDGIPLANGLYIYLIRIEDRCSDLSRLVIRR